ncbi:MAG TPA: ATP-dependent metallopeptidase FtsH/Yme1/Tma family protein [Rhizomicrobium sp.]|nr:ATP-dependent metallopeptidase FtsH/Yme1/Tma family protein [Rhizomicrobium sp.]
MRPIPRQPEKRPSSWRNWALAGLLLLAGIAAFAGVQSRLTESKPIPYSEFRSLLEKNLIAEVTVGQNEISGTLKLAANEKEPRRFTTIPVDPSIAADLEKHRVVVNGEPAAGWLETLVVGQFEK